MPRALEMSAHIDTVVMDKTGTLTKGEPEVTDVVTMGLPAEEVLALAAAVEAESEHPLAAAVVRYARANGVAPLRAVSFRSTPGQGTTAVVDGKTVRVGSARLLMDAGVGVPSTLQEKREELASSGRTAVFVAVGQSAVAVVALADAPRDTAARAVEALHERGVRVVMLTGDNEATARRIASELGIDEVIAGVLPDGKSQQIAALQRQGRTVAMVGDGVNDAPALAQADLGIAIGAGTDVAIETADVVLMRSDPLDVAVALAIGTGTVRKMRQNLGWAIGYNAIALPIAAGLFVPAFGLMLRPEIAALTMSGSSLLVAMNALLLKRLRSARAGDVTGSRPAIAAGPSLRRWLGPRDRDRTGKPADAQNKFCRVLRCGELQLTLLVMAAWRGAGPRSGASVDTVDHQAGHRCQVRVEGTCMRVQCDGERGPA